MRSFRQTFLGMLSGWLLVGIHRHKPKVSGGDLRKTEFKTSTQDLSIRFGDTLRNTFRFRWLKKHT